MVIFIMNILPHIFGAFALGAWVSSVQVKKKTSILFFQLLANAFFAAQYFLLGLVSTALLNLFSVFRSCVFGINAKKNKNNPLWLLIFLLLIIFILALIYCDNFLALIPVCTTILYTVSTWQNNTNYLRYVFIICAILFLIYNFKVGAYIALLGNLFELISGAISVLRFDEGKRK